MDIQEVFIKAINGLSAELKEMCKEPEIIDANAFFNHAEEVIKAAIETVPVEERYFPEWREKIYQEWKEREQTKIDKHNEECQTK